MQNENVLTGAYVARTLSFQVSLILTLLHYLPCFLPGNKN